MGFKQRERKRKAKAAQARAQAVGRHGTSSSPATSRSRWWLTVIKRDTCCARCAAPLRAGKEMVYRHTPREALCKACADAAGVFYRPSLGWSKERNRQRKLKMQPRLDEEDES